MKEKILFALLILLSTSSVYAGLFDVVKETGGFISNIMDTMHRIKWMWVYAGIGMFTTAWIALGKLARSDFKMGERLQVAVANFLKWTRYVGVFLIAFQFRETIFEVFQGVADLMEMFFEWVSE